MKFLIKIALRNLFRQKRRNVFLGSAMAVGVAILVVAGSFSRGISDNIMNKVLRWAAGHISIVTNDRGRMTSVLCRDKERVMAHARDIKDVLKVEEAIGAYARVIGNGKSDFAVLVGVDVTANISDEDRREIEKSFRLLDGSWEDLNSSSVENPAIISEEKARYLNVKNGDIIRIRLRSATGQDQAARVTVSGIMKNDNIFMQPVIFESIANAKAISGIRPHETGEIHITVKNPEKNAITIANTIHNRLKPGLAAIAAQLISGSNTSEGVLLGYKSDAESKKKLEGLLNLRSGTIDAALADKGVIVSTKLAGKLGLQGGSSFDVTYQSKFDNRTVNLPYTVSAVYDAPDSLGLSVLINDNLFYATYYDNLPLPVSGGITIPEAGSPWYAVLAPEWILLPRTITTKELEKKYKDMGKSKWKASLVDVRTMYESASDILKLEGILNLITISAVIVLFFIILIGVINTLRMTIRERTREIGTIRAIGMQKNDVRAIFLLETVFLTFFASLAGVAIGFILMIVLSHIPINLENNPLGMLLVSGKLYFLPAPGQITAYIIFIMAIAAATAFFPSNRAANMPPAKALGHFD